MALGIFSMGGSISLAGSKDNVPVTRLEKQRFEIRGFTLPLELMHEVTRQAAEIAYVNDFYMLMWITLAAMPLVLLLSNPDRRPPAPVPA